MATLLAQNESIQQLFFYYDTFLHMSEYCHSIVGK
jgi:hypothetical protein